MRKVLSLVLLLFFMLGSAVPAWAEPVTYAQTFGYTQARNRDGLVVGKLIVPAWYHNGGRSFSQPLLFSGRAWGFVPEQGDPDVALAVTVEKNYLYGFKFPPGTLQLSYFGKNWPPLWGQPLSAITKSHPTLVKWQIDGKDKKLIFIGTESQYLNVFDVTDFGNAQPCRPYKTPYATDIVSAPTVFNWRGHMAVVYTCGNTGNVAVTFDPLDSKKEISYIIPLGSGRTSSSPAPILKNGPGPYDYAGFAVGRDQGPNDGKLYVLRFDDLFAVRDGRVVKKNNPSVYAVEDLRAGLVASFSVSDDGNVIYFGDCQSHFYAYDVVSRKFLWKNINSPVAGMFSNRSPALGTSTVIFPAGTKPGQGTPGALVALDRFTGAVRWVARFQSSIAQTAPVILRAPDGSAVVAVGTGDKSHGYIGLFDANTGEKLTWAPVCSAGDFNRYAMGASGELAFVGFWGVTTDSEGSIGWFIATHLDFAAVKLDPGVPEGQKAKAGQVYTATVEFGSQFDTWFTGLAEVGIDADVNGQPVMLTDESGNELPKVSFNGKQFYVLRPVPKGEGKWTVKFRWTAKAAPGADKAVLRAWINLEMGRISATWPESDGASPTEPKNNLVRAEVPVEEPCTDISVVSPYRKPSGDRYVGFNTEIGATVRRANDGPSGPVQVRVTVTGPGGFSKVKTFNLNRGESRKVSYVVQVNKPGTATFTFHAVPVGIEDCAPGNNRAAVSFQVKPDPSVPPPESKSWVELISSR